MFHLAGIALLVGARSNLGTQSILSTPPALYQIETGHHQDLVVLSEFLSDGSVVTVCRDGTIREWTDSGGPLRPPIRLFAIDSSHRTVESAALSGRLLAVGHTPPTDDEGSSSTVSLVDLASNSGSIKVLEGPRTGDAIDSLSFSPDCKFLAAASGLKVRVWKLDDGSSKDITLTAPNAALETWTLEHTVVGFDASGKSIVAGGLFQSGTQYESILTAFDTLTQKEQGSTTLDGRLFGLNRTRNGEIAFAGDSQGTWRIAAKETRLSVPKGAASGCANVVCLPKSNKLCFAGSPDLKTGALFVSDESTPIKVSNFPLFSIGSDLEGRRVVAGDSQGGVWVVDLISRVAKPLSPPQPPVTDIGFGSNDELLTGYGDVAELFSFDGLTATVSDKHTSGPWLKSGEFKMSMGKAKGAVLIGKAGSDVVQIHASISDSGSGMFAPGTPLSSPLSFVPEHEGHLFAVGASHGIVMYSFGDSDIQAMPVKVAGKLAVAEPASTFFTNFAVSADGKYISALENNHQIDVYSVDAVLHGTASPLLILYMHSPDNGQPGEWVIWNPALGVYAASPGGSKMLGVQINQGPDKVARLATADEVRDQFYNPQGIRSTFKSGQPPASMGATLLSVIPSTPDISVDPYSGLVPDSKRPGYYTTTKTQVQVNITFSSRITSVHVEENVAAKDVGIQTGANQQVLPVNLHPGPNYVSFVGSNASGFSDRVVWHVDCHPAGGEDWNGSLHVLSVGINQYDSKAIRALNASVSDAKSVDDFYAVKGRLPGPAPTNDLIPESQADSKSVLAKIQDVISKAADGDDLLLFLSGHGSPDNQKFYFLTKDADITRLASTALDWQLVIDAIKKSKLRNAVIVADACFSGGAIGEEAKLRSQETINATSAAAHVFLLVSSTPFQESYEDSEGKGSVFTDTFLEVLGDHIKSGSNEDKDPLVYLNKKLYAEILTKIIARSTAENLPGIQVPLIWPPDDQAPIAARTVGGEHHQSTIKKAFAGLQ